MLKKKREIKEKQSVKYAEVWHKFKYESNILHADGAASMEKSIWPLHWTMQLNKISETDEIEKNLTTLQDMATK